MRSLDRRTFNRTMIGVVVGLALVAAGCGSDSDSSSDSLATTGPSTDAPLTSEPTGTSDAAVTTGSGSTPTAPDDASDEGQCYEQLGHVSFSFVAHTHQLAPPFLDRQRGQRAKPLVEPRERICIDRHQALNIRLPPRRQRCSLQAGTRDCWRERPAKLSCVA